MRNNKQSPQIGSFASFLREQALEKKLFESVNSKKHDQKDVCEALYKKKIGRSKQEVCANRMIAPRDESFMPNSGHLPVNDKPAVFKNYLLSTRSKQRIKCEAALARYQKELEEKGKGEMQFRG